MPLSESAETLGLEALRSAYEDDRLRWQVAVDAAGVGAFDWELATDTLRWDDRLLELFGLDRATFGGTIEAFNACVHPDDRDRVSQALGGAIATCGEYAAEYRVVLPGGRERWIAARGVAVPGDDGLAVRVVGAAYDTTAVREGEARVGRTLDALPTGFCHLDTEWRFTYANPTARRLLGAAGDVVGQVLWELFPETVGTEHEERYRAAVETGKPVAFEAYVPAPVDTWLEIRCWPTPDGLSLHFLDVSDRRRALDLLDRAGRRTALLAEVTGALTGTLDGEEAVGRLADLVVPLLGDWCVVTMVDGTSPADPTRDRLWRTRLTDLGWSHAEPSAAHLVATYAAGRVPALTDDSLVARVLSTGKAVVVDDEAFEVVSKVLNPGPARDAWLRLGAASAAIVPLPGRGRIAGLMSVFRGPARGPFPTDVLEVLDEIAGRAGLALDAVNAYTSQRELAEGLQRSLLTAPPERADAEIAVRYQPAAETAQVGGDWYDAFVQPGDALNLVIGDVIGHDTIAAAAMGQLRGLVRGISVTTGEGPAEVLGRVDQAMGALALDTLATVVVARLEPAASEAPGGRSLRWSSSGHPPPVLVSSGTGSRVVEALWSEEPDTMLGLGPGADRVESVRPVASGDLVVLYTDGLVERRDQSLHAGVELLRTTVAELAEADLDLDGICDGLLARMLPARNEDDVALVALRLR